MLDRNRGGAFAAVGLVGAGMFGVFLFLTYYLQPTLRFSPIETGLAFLPMVGALMLTATTTSAAVLPRVGPKPLVTAGMLLAAVGMLLLTLRSDCESPHRAPAHAQQACAGTRSAPSSVLELWRSEGEAGAPGFVVRSERPNGAIPRHRSARRAAASEDFGEAWSAWDAA